MHAKNSQIHKFSQAYHGWPRSARLAAKCGRQWLWAAQGRESGGYATALGQRVTVQGDPPVRPALGLPAIGVKPGANAGRPY